MFHTARVLERFTDALRPVRQGAGARLMHDGWLVNRHSEPRLGPAGRPGVRRGSGRQGGGAGAGRGLRRPPARRRPRGGGRADHARDRAGDRVGPGLALPHAERRRLVRQRHLPGQYRRHEPGRPGLHGRRARAPAAALTGPRSTRRCSTSWTTPSPSGFIAVAAASTHGPMYSHGFGTLFLAEAYGMTHRPEIREKLQKAVRLIIDTQNAEGGWRYQPVRRDADLSVTICQINALRPPGTPGCSSPRRRSRTASATVKQSQNPDGGFRYMLQGGASAFPRSAAGVVALYSAAVYDAKEIEAGDRLPPAVHARDQARQPLQPLFLWPLLRRPGDVDPGGRGLEHLVSRDPRRAGPPPVVARRLLDTTSICNEYGTAMALIILQMPNNYLPIFQR